MLTTETDRPKARIPNSFPTLNLLYTPASGIVGQVFCLREGAMSIGRELNSEESIGLQGDKRASRRHASILFSTVDATFKIILRDEQSKNGTYVNGTQISTATLRDGDVLRIGNSLLLLRIASARPLDADLPLLRGRAPAIGCTRHRLSELAPSSTPVLLFGEPGVGKELAAQSVHDRSRRQGQFLARNCAGLTESLADSLLFGHERGAFTGATVRQEGAFVAAQGGTLFLDEVAELPLPVQAKLLRTLQEGEVLPVGRTHPVHVDVRVVAATNRDLNSAVKEGLFRDDLYSRLRGAVVTLPTLRERREDILTLLGHFFGTTPQLTPRLAEALLLYDWPHNVRELVYLAHDLRRKAEIDPELDLPLIEARLLRRACGEIAAADGETSSTSSIPPADGSAPPSSEGPKLTRETLERWGLETRWNVSRMAKFAGLSRRQLSRLLDKFGFPRPSRLSIEKDGKKPPDGDSED